MTNETTASQPKSIGDDAQFNVLADAMCWNYVENYVNGGSAEKAQQAKNSRRNFIEYVDNFRAPAAQASAAIQAAPDEHPDNAAVQAFADAMKAKMAKSRAKGRGGWEECHAEDLRRMLVDHMAKGDPVDVGNFAMMLWNRGESTAAAIQEPVMVAGTSEREKALERSLRQAISQNEGGWLFNADEISTARRALSLAAPMVADPAGVAALEAEIERLKSEAVELEKWHHAKYKMSSDYIAGLEAKLAATVKAVPSEALEDLIMQHRIAITPENEGGFHAHIYRDQDEPVTTGYGATPREAVDIALAAPLADKTGGGE